MPDNEEDENLEEIESDPESPKVQPKKVLPKKTVLQTTKGVKPKELIDVIPNRKVIITDKKLKIVIPVKDDETDILLDEPKPIKKLIKIKQIVPPNSDEEDVIEKPKAKRTQKQIDAFQKVRDKKMENARLREQERKLLLEQQQKELEEKIIKKAVSLKKKQIKKQAVLEDISDDETPIEVIKEIKRKIPAPQPVPVKQAPKFKFV
jgi:hypothetical protein